MLRTFSALVFVLAAFPVLSQAFTPSPQQIAQFKNLPRAQQEALARQYGVDLSSITGSTQAQPQVIEQQGAAEMEEQATMVAQAKQKERQQPEEDLQLFGYDLFDGDVQPFSDMRSLPIPANYIVGPGDELVVDLFGKESNSYNLEIDSSGMLFFPELGPIEVGGLTYAELKQKLASVVAEKMIGIQSVVRLSSLRSMQIFVVGDAFKPGAYTVSSLATITHGLFAAGGVSEIGSLRNIQVKRAGELVATFDLYDLLVNGDISNDIRLQPMDVILINPIGETVSVEGAVRRPAVYELKENTNLQSLVRLAGGLQGEARSDQIRVQRISKQLLRKPLNLDLAEAGGAFIVQGGDKVNVPTIGQTTIDKVELMGAVTLPGEYAWQSGVTVVDLVQSRFTGLNEDADLTYSLVIRQINEFKDIEVLQFSLAHALKDPDSTHNIALERNDKILVFDVDRGSKQSDSRGGLAAVNVDADVDIDAELKDVAEKRAFSRSEMLKPVLEQLTLQAKGELAAYVEVAGEVLYPGRYPITKGFSAQSLLDAAGGFTESAYKREAELIEYYIGDKGQLSSRTDEIDLTNGDLAKSLSPRSYMQIHTIPDWSEQQYVTISGEVRFPGTYAFKRGDTLKDVVARAGGLTRFAFVEGTVFTREKVRQQQSAQINRYAEELKREVSSQSFRNRLNTAAQVTSFDELQRMIDSLKELEPSGRMVIDLSRALYGTEESNFALESGDKLMVPPNPDSVSVLGMVQFENAHFFQAGQDMQHYIELSGGTKQQADESRIYVIKANGSVIVPDSGSFWFSNDEEPGLIAAGDTIVVPLDVNYMESLSIWTAVTQIMYQTGVALAAVKTF